MKTIINILMVCLLVCSISSCTQKVIIKGTPGTEIYEPGSNSGLAFKRLGVVGDNGEAEIKLTTEKYFYYAYLWSYNAEEDKYYPFGLDYEYKRLYWKTIRVFLTIPLTLGLSPLLDEQAVEGYQYVKEQTIDSNPNAPYANTGERRKIKGSTGGSRLLLPGSTGSSSASKLLQKDYGNLLQGKYTGDAKLLHNGNTVETYTGMVIEVTPVNKNSVAVKVLLNGSDEIFAPCKYTISKQGENHFILISEHDESSTIEIENGSAVYNNPNVNIEGDIYTLHITANK